MRAPKDILPTEAVIAAEVDDVLSPESYVYVALMSVEEGPNKAGFLQVVRSTMIDIGAGELPSPPLSVGLPR